MSKKRLSGSPAGRECVLQSTVECVGRVVIWLGVWGDFGQGAGKKRGGNKKVYQPLKKNDQPLNNSPAFYCFPIALTRDFKFESQPGRAAARTYKNIYSIKDSF
jgi:hypothetical protein